MHSASISDRRKKIVLRRLTGAKIRVRPIPLLGLVMAETDKSQSSTVSAYSFAKHQRKGSVCMRAGANRISGEWEEFLEPSHEGISKRLQRV